MNALLGDAWLYAFAAGLLVFGAFFLFSLGKYRSVGRPVLDGPLGLPVDAGAPAEPVKVVAAPKRAAGPAERAPEPARVEAKSPPSSGSGPSPAVLYLKNLKVQMETFEEEIHQLRSQVSAFAQKHDQQFDALLARMSQLQSELHDQVRENQPPPAPAVQVTSPAPAAAAPVAEPEPTERTIVEVPRSKKTSPEEIFSAEEVRDLTLEPPPPAKAPAPSVAETAPAHQATQPVEEEDILKPKGKGPVWPV